MNFYEAESYLLSLGNEISAMKLGLENIRKLLNALGDPQNNYTKVQVAGTNGKGSVCAFLNSICQQAGVRAGVYTSPHLVSITERVNIGGVDISEDEFARIATYIRETSEELVLKGELESVPTFFEQVTAIALLAFAEAKVELAILETGLGGRLDATTAANAEIVAITRIDLDHQEYLGNTIAEIAAEKASIIRADSKVVVGAQRPEALKVILDRCQELGIVPQAANKRYVWEMDRSGKTTVHEFDVEPPPDLGVPLGLLGRHQVENAHTAIMVSSSLANDFGFEISEEQDKHGIANACHSGRLEYIGNVLLDGAHNVSGTRALRAYLDEFADRPITMIVGAMRDKQVKEIAHILWPKADILILTQPSNSRAMTAEELSEFVPDGYLRECVMLTASIDEALKTATQLLPDNGLILVTGSLYLVGEVKKLLNN